jgi:hypothetical protein
MKFKKFKIKVEHYNKNNYCIKYTNSIIPFWKTLSHWRYPISYDYPISDGWYPILGNFSWCEEEAKKFKSIEDIHIFIKDIPEKISKYKEIRSEDMKKHRPYYSKIIE